MKNRILELLRTEARLTNAEIARRLDCSEEEVAREISRIEADRTILGYRAIVNPEKLDDEPCLAIIEVKITPQRHVGYDEIAAQVYKFPEVRMCYLLSGGYDLLVFIEAANLKDAAGFVSNKLATLDNVTSTATHFVLKKYKDAGVVIAGDTEAVDRLPVTP